MNKLKVLVVLLMIVGFAPAKSVHTSAPIILEYEFKSGRERLLGDLKKIKEKQKAAPKPEPPTEVTPAVEPVVESCSNSCGLSEYEVELLCELVECEAGGESFDGKVAVAQVVLNRINSSSFPNSMEGVVYQSGQFQPAMDGILGSKIPSDDTRAAVNSALQGANIVGDCLYFWAAYVSQDNPIWNNGYTYQIGNHVFN